MKGCLVVFQGMSGAGKDTIVDRLVKNKRDRHKVISLTTRPMRVGEKSGTEYIFVDKDSFKDSIVANKFLEYRSYKVLNEKNDDIWYYGTRKDEIKPNKENFGILDVEGVKFIAQKLPKLDIITIFVDVDFETRLKRAKKREGKKFDIEEFKRRHLDDMKTMEKAKEDADYVVKNNDLDRTVAQLEMFLEYESSKRRFERLIDNEKFLKDILTNLGKDDTIDK